MDRADWVKLLQRIPPEQHDNLLLMTRSGQDVTVQMFARLEEHYAVIRGRMAGTSDADRMFFIPYDQIVYLQFVRPVLDDVVVQMFGQQQQMMMGMQQMAPRPAPAEAPPPETAPAPAPAEPEPDKPAPLRHPTPTSVPNVAALLDRIRQRTQVAAADRANVSE